MTAAAAALLILSAALHFRGSRRWLGLRFVRLASKILLLGEALIVTSIRRPQEPGA